MKFPLAESPFPVITPTRSEVCAYDDIAHAVAAQAVAEYQEFVHVRHRSLDAKHWKAVKTLENVVVYRAIVVDDASGSGSGSDVTASSDSNSNSTSVSGHSSSYLLSGMSVAASSGRVPKLLAIGTLTGSFDDVMLGVIAPDAQECRLRSAYTKDELVDWRQLALLRRSSPRDPYRFTSLKWLVRSCASAASPLMRPRDATILDSTGLTTLPNGERIGFQVVQSVEIPFCPELQQSHGIVRAVVSICYLFRAKTESSVEVFTTAFMDLGGQQRGDRQALPLMANSLLACCRLPWCGQNRKLVWMLKQAANIPRYLLTVHSDDTTRHASVTPKTALARGWLMHHSLHCPVCHTSASTYRTISACQLCHREVCSRCTTTRKLFYLRDHHAKEIMSHETTSLCKSCVARASRTSAFDVALYEFLRCRYNQYDAMRKTVNAPLLALMDAAVGRTLAVATGGMAQRSALLHHRAPPKTTASCEDQRTSRASETRSAAATGPAVGSSAPSGHAREAGPDDEASHRYEPDPTVSANTEPCWTQPEQDRLSQSHHHYSLWWQLSQLRVAAEEAFETTRKNETVMKESRMWVTELA